MMCISYKSMALTSRFRNTWLGTIIHMCYFNSKHWHKLEDVNLSVLSWTPFFYQFNIPLVEVGVCPLWEKWCCSSSSSSGGGCTSWWPGGVVCSMLLRRSSNLLLLLMEAFSLCAVWSAAAPILRERSVDVVVNAKYVTACNFQQSMLKGGGLLLLSLSVLLGPRLLPYLL